MNVSARAVGLSFLLVACSGASSPAPEEQPTTEEPSAGPATPEATAPADPAPPSCDTGPSPWGNSVPDDDIRPDSCAQTAHAVGPPCETNSDCGICHDGSDCGRAANREEIERLGGECCQPDAAECEYAVVRCCAGHCQVTGD